MGSVRLLPLASAPLVVSVPLVMGAHAGVFVTGACPPPAAGKGLVEAAHFCYLMAHVPFGYYTVKTDHLALLGSSHRYVIWGKGNRKDVFWGISLALVGLHSSIFWCEFQLPPVPSSGVVFCRARRCPAGAASHHQVAFRGNWCPCVVLCTSGHLVAPWVHDQGSL